LKIGVKRKVGVTFDLTYPFATRRGKETGINVAGKGVKKWWMFKVLGKKVDFVRELGGKKEGRGRKILQSGFHLW